MPFDKNNSPRIEFDQRIKESAEKIQKLSKKSAIISTIRISLFVLSLIGLVYFANERQALIVAAILVSFLLLFFLLVKSTLSGNTKYSGTVMKKILI